LVSRKARRGAAAQRNIAVIAAPLREIVFHAKKQKSAKTQKADRLIAAALLPVYVFRPLRGYSLRTDKLLKIL
jgi:hypothetical protein